MELIGLILLICADASVYTASTSAKRGRQSVKVVASAHPIVWL
jgi:hypothetical protein